MFDLDRDHFRKPPTDVMAFDPKAEPLTDTELSVSKPMTFDEAAAWVQQEMERNCRCLLVPMQTAKLTSVQLTEMEKNAREWCGVVTFVEPESDAIYRIRIIDECNRLGLSLLHYAAHHQVGDGLSKVGNLIGIYRGGVA